MALVSVLEDIPSLVEVRVASSLVEPPSSEVALTFPVALEREEAESLLVLDVEGFSWEVL